VLNIYNPCYVSGGLQLDLSRWEERQVVKMLIHLSTVEPGENCKTTFSALLVAICALHTFDAFAATVAKMISSPSYSSAD
jgi:hypothetical protein